MSVLAFVFPGQGSQAVGMLATAHERFAAVRECYAEASEALGFDVARLSLEGPESDLNRTEFTQPALLTAGVALWRAWLAQGGARPAFLAGHSLGEYTALVAAGALTLADGARLVRERGRLMQAAVPEGQGAMAAVLNAELALLSEACVAASVDGEAVVPANLNAPGQIVISGHAAAVDRALAALAARGVKRAIKLPVSVPSHSPLMRSAAEQFAERLRAVTWSAPSIPVIHNADVTSHVDAVSMQAALAAQLYSPVRWIETIESLAQQGVTRLAECGPGKVLLGMVKRIAPGIEGRSLAEPDALIECVEAWKS